MYRPSPLYPENWNRLRHALFKEAGYRCQVCGRYAKGDLHLHHIVPISISHDNSRENLIVLCSDCHYKVHKKIIKIERR